MYIFIIHFICMDIYITNIIYIYYMVCINMLISIFV